MADTTNKYNFLDYEGLSLFWNNVKKVIGDNELVTATALTNLDTRVNTVEDFLSNQIISITYTDLKTLRDNAQLVPGQQYRITDYTCTTTQENTRAVGHAFDIIVTADDASTINEVARAVKHDGDTYFAGCDLNAWKIWYCLDNDTTRFAWADSANGKGVIYRMIDEFDNDIPYDFKNIQFKHPNDTTTYPYYYYTFASGNVEDNTDCSLNIACVCYSNTIKNTILHGENINETPMILNQIIFIGTVCVSNTFGYDCNSNSFGEFCGYNTFGNSFSGNTFGDGCLGNTFGNDGESNIFGYGYADNTFGNRCSDNSFGNSCSGNTFGDDCYSNTFGDDCYSNTFGDDCYSNTFGNLCYSNAFGDECSSNAFGDDCADNTFGNRCSDNTFGNDCVGNTFGYECDYNTFGNNCSTNTFGDFCNSNAFGDGCSSNAFGNDGESNTFGNSCQFNTFGNECQYIKFTLDNSDASTKYNYYRHNHFGDGCQYILFKGTETASYESEVQNYNFAQGLKGTEAAYLTIDGVRNLSYETKVAKNSIGELKIYCEADLIK